VTELIRADAPRRSSMAALAIGGLVVGVLWFTALAILLALQSGMITLRTSAERSTASAVADRQIERYRALAFAAIYLDPTLVGATDSTYQTDTAYSASQVTQTCTPLSAACTPSPSNPTQRCKG